MNPLTEGPDHVVWLRLPLLYRLLTITPPAKTLEKSENPKIGKSEVEKLDVFEGFKPRECQNRIQRKKLVLTALTRAL